MNKIAILGSTGTIGSITLKIIKKNKKAFKINLLSTNSNVKKLFNQALEFNVKNVIILNKSKSILWQKKFKKKKNKSF